MNYTLNVHLFGRFSASSQAGLLGGFTSHKAQELFCYLLLHRARAHHREVLADALWGEQPNARKYLRKALWQLQRSLAALDEHSQQPVLLVDAEWLQINPAASIWVDAHVFETAYQSVRRRRGHELSRAEFSHLRNCLELYTGDLLERMYCDWSIFERERYRDIYLATVFMLMDYCEAHQEYAAGVKYGKLILRTDRVQERTHRKLMRIYYLAGDRVAALRQYEDCKAALAEELAVQPSRLTQELHRRIQNEQHPPAGVYLATDQITRSLQRIHHLLAFQADPDPRLELELHRLEQALIE
jgi:DNA-binding SARP family transcriptional activator